jgi:molecular chaperone GrpE
MSMSEAEKVPMPEKATAAPLSAAMQALISLAPEDLADRYLRLKADHQRSVERGGEERALARAQERERVLSAFLDVVDNLERGLECACDEAEANNPWRQGMEGIQRQMHEVLEHLGVRPMEAEGVAFDPSAHEAVSTMADAERVDGTVAAVVRRGYVAGESVLRPARVVVVKNES